MSNKIQRDRYLALISVETHFASMKPVRVSALTNAIGKIDTPQKLAIARKAFDRKDFGRAKCTGMGVKSDKLTRKLYGKATKHNPNAKPLDTYVSSYIGPVPVIREVVDQAGRVMLPGERGTIKKNRSMPRSAASKHGGVGAKNKLRASAMVDSFLMDAANQKREIASVKANAVIAHFAGVDVETLPRKQRQSARRALRKAFANL